MNSFSRSDLDLSIGSSSSRSHLLTESLPHNDDDDLSLSELSVSDRYNTQPKFSLFARPHRENPVVPSSPVEAPATASKEHGDEKAENTNREDAEEGTGHSPLTESQPARPKLDREEQLQADAFMLRKINAAMGHYLETLEYAESANISLATRLGETDALLNKYIGILETSEEFTRLILDEQWEGAEGDELRLEQMRIEAEERIRREAEERERQKQKEERERKEKEAKLERERAEREQREKAVARGGVRGVRGTRASMRSRAAPTAVTRGRARGSAGRA